MVRKEGVGDHSPGVLGNVLPELLILDRPLLRIHGDGIEVRLGEILGVPRVHHQTAIQTLSRTGKFGQNENTLGAFVDWRCIRTTPDSCRLASRRRCTHPRPRTEQGARQN